MPYIAEDKRKVLDPIVDNLRRALARLEEDDDMNSMGGNINYVITKLLRLVYGTQGYNNIQEAVGILECVKLEHYRTIAAPYENQKRFENGDVNSDVPIEMISEVIVYNKPND